MDNHPPSSSPPPTSPVLLYSWPRQITLIVKPIPNPHARYQTKLRTTFKDPRTPDSTQEPDKGGEGGLFS
ncbi:hypothetical protein BDDG_11830 [Blastomyces dermatitidis ATCC 18188]|uniref:Uncharacterized protein n=1 Tax=Ajellomyces dermatitidis (strain ATCC 18188 / CBS 674.68) TaxID=653446 RepID=A0A0J9ENZ8_AJEDA|nr:hypothetical protein BDDG_11830 [Blastomyces dermatitidis ATCC 18188]